MRTGLAVSSVAHAVILGWGLLTFAPTPLEAPLTEAMPVDLVPVSEITRTKQGARSAPKLEEAKPVAEKVEQPKPAPEVEKKVEKQPEIKPAAAPPPPTPISEEPKKQEVKKEEAKPDPIKDLLAKEEAKELKKTPPKKEQPKLAEKPKQPPVKQRNFDPDRIAALLDKREPQRQKQAAEQISNSRSLGNSSGSSQQLSMSELDALRRQIESCWRILPGAGNSEPIRIVLRFDFKRDGTLAGRPVVVNPVNTPAFQAAADSAVRAVIECQPYKMLSPEKYEMWREMEAGFRAPEYEGG